MVLDFFALPWSHVTDASVLSAIFICISVILRESSKDQTPSILVTEEIFRKNSLLNVA